ncbi:MAG: radical SAM family heme chaperone HemW [Bacilli bacterium]|nr:radical SAM family heme chaperone HemW [Bacilli bacterium]
MKSCYIHIPFCQTICSYCDFCKQFYHKEKVKDYLLKLKEEILRDYKGEVLDTIYIGGGTPTCLSLKELEILFDILQVFKKSSSCEFTMEANCETLTKEKLICMRNHGVNRLSIGVESVQPKQIKYLERNHSKEDISRGIFLAREVGFQNINVDLIYALSFESMEDLKRDLDFVVSLDVEHISTYSLMIEDHTKLGIQQVKPISDEMDRDMYYFIVDFLKKHGYQHYEISNFAKEGYFSKHNLCYWHNEEYYGFGLGAASYVSHVRSCNTRSPLHYPNKKIEVENLNQSEREEYEVLLNLRLQEGLSLERFKNKYGKDLFDCFAIKKLIEEGWLLEENGFIRIPEKYWYVSNEILVKILQKKIELC